MHIYSFQLFAINCQLGERNIYSCQVSAFSPLLVEYYFHQFVFF